jgi:hypothetical protein
MGIYNMYRGAKATAHDVAAPFRYAARTARTTKAPNDSARASATMVILVMTTAFAYLATDKSSDALLPGMVVGLILAMLWAVVMSVVRAPVIRTDDDDTDE